MCGKVLKNWSVIHTNRGSIGIIFGYMCLPAVKALLFLLSRFQSFVLWLVFVFVESTWIEVAADKTHHSCIFWLSRRLKPCYIQMFTFVLRWSEYFQTARRKSTIFARQVAKVRAGYTHSASKENWFFGWGHGPLGSARWAQAYPDKGSVKAWPVWIIIINAKL